ncbi:MAG: sigma-54 dependent transcriptional regulator [Desulfobacteraceae bacterium]
MERTGPDMADYPENPVLIVDDEEHILTGFSAELKYNGIKNIVLCKNAEKVMDLVGQTNPSMIFLDLIMPKLSGHVLLERLRTHYPQIPVVVVTASSDTRTVVECMKKGAHNFLTKPVEPKRLFTVCRRTLEYREMRQEIDHLSTSLLEKKQQRPAAFNHIITRNAHMASIFRYIESIAPTCQPLFITGETGTGKDLVARAVHDLGRNKENFVKINTAGLDDNMFSDTLFGHAKGAYTGADALRRGLVEQAAGGTLFLDEIGDLSLASQIKLLDLIQDRSYMRIGEDKIRYTDTRIIAATNLAVQNLKNTDRFRKDLYFRLMTHHVHLPALRKRIDDIEILLHHFVKKACKEIGKPIPDVPDKTISVLKHHSFPGNVRELESMVFDAVAVSKTGMLDIEPFYRHMTVFQENNYDPDPASKGRKIEEGRKIESNGIRGREIESSDIEGREIEDRVVEGREVEKSKIKRDENEKGEFESDKINASEIFAGIDSLPTLKTTSKLLVKEALRRTQGNQSEAAKILGISRHFC